MSDTFVCAIIARYVEMQRKHLIGPDATLAELYLDPVFNLPGIAMDIEDEHGVTLCDVEVGGWRTVADIEASMERARERNG